jgi:hypothetical protein
LIKQKVSSAALSLGEHFQARTERLQRFTTIRDFDALQTRLKGEVDTATQTMKPGALGLHETLLKKLPFGLPLLTGARRGDSPIVELRHGTAGAVVPPPPARGDQVDT